jgi:hypothetical protein
MVMNLRIFQKLEDISKFITIVGPGWHDQCSSKGHSDETRTRTRPMKTTALQTKTLISQPNIPVRKTARIIVLRTEPTNSATARPTDSAIDAWARHASASNGFAEVI